MLVDSHVNLHGDPYAEDLEDVLARAGEAGVGAMLAICDRLDSVDAIAAIVDARRARGERMWRSVGAHPHHAKDHRDLTAERLARLAAAPEVIGIGETGLDFHYRFSEEADQLACFRAHIDAARETGLPLIIHTRDADEAMADILEEETAKGAFPILLHCYTGGPELAARGLALGAYVSFSGIVTFRKADNVRAAAADVPLERMLIETDCPYLAPTPHRGKRNEPAFLPHVAEAIADLKGVSLEETAAATTKNFFDLFSKAERID
ncbi:MAG: TatD family hydrolase [Pseudomonadota bacterium]